MTAEGQGRLKPVAGGSWPGLGLPVGHFKIRTCHPLDVGADSIIWRCNRGTSASRTTECVCVCLRLQKCG